MLAAGTEVEEERPRHGRPGSRSTRRQSVERDGQGQKGGGETEGPSASRGRGAPVSTQSTPVIGIPRGRTWARGACGAERDSRSPVRASGRAGRALRTSLKERGLVHPCADAGRGGGRTRTLCQLTVGSHHTCAAFGAPRRSRPDLPSAQRLRPRDPVCMHAPPCLDARMQAQQVDFGCTFLRGSSTARHLYSWHVSFRKKFARFHSVHLCNTVTKFQQRASICNIVTKYSGQDSALSRATATGSYI